MKENACIGYSIDISWTKWDNFIFIQYCTGFKKNTTLNINMLVFFLIFLHKLVSLIH
jgi:hypothetical protein